MELQDFELNAFFAHVVDALERIGIQYMVVGGFAAIIHGEPRFTADVDIVADMQLRHLSNPSLSPNIMSAKMRSSIACIDAFRSM